MANKPSQWTPQEAWEKSAKHHCHLWGLNPYENQCDSFPADPVDRVSDDDLNMIVAMGEEARPTVRRMALELIERRKADGEKR